MFLFLLTQAGLCYIKPVLHHCSIMFIKRLHYLAATQRTLRDSVSATSHPSLPPPPHTLTWHPLLHGDISHVSGLTLPHYCHLGAKKMRDAALIPNIFWAKFYFAIWLGVKWSLKYLSRAILLANIPALLTLLGVLQLYRIKH